jgi:dipeptidyl aminopeptidase/acylaminoacyl peptidase
VYVADVDSGDARRVTDSAYRLPPDDELVQPELVAIPGERGDIPAWLYRAGGDGAAPAVMYVHGGPESQVRAGYLPIAQYLVSRGISVIAPNIRGSTGYGKTYQRSIYRDWGHGDLADFRAIGQWLLQQEWVDDTRLGVCGGSYGGFATLLCLSRLPDVWSVGVDVFGPSNLISLIATAPPTWYSVVREMIGDPDRDREKLLAGSPLTHADAIRAPLLVVQGAKDPRVVPAESEQLVERLRDLGRDVDYVLFDDEGHGFTRHENELRGWRLLGEFLERHLVGA